MQVSCQRIYGNISMKLCDLMSRTMKRRSELFGRLLRLGAQSFTLLNTLRDPTQLRWHQWATRQQHLFFGCPLLSSLEQLISAPNHEWKRISWPCLVAHWRHLNCVGSLKVFHNVTLWAPNLSFCNKICYENFWGS